MTSRLACRRCWRGTPSANGLARGGLDLRAPGQVRLVGLLRRLALPLVQKLPKLRPTTGALAQRVPRLTLRGPDRGHALGSVGAAASARICSAIWVAVPLATREALAANFVPSTAIKPGAGDGCNQLAQRSFYRARRPQALRPRGATGRRAPASSPRSAKGLLVGPVRRVCRPQRSAQRIELRQKVDAAHPCPAPKHGLAMSVRCVSAAEPGRSLLVARAASMPAVSGDD